MKKALVLLIAIMWIGGTALAQSSTSEDENLKIRIGDKAVGTVEDVRIDKSSQGSRISIHVDAKFVSFPQKLDEILKEKGNLGGCQQRFFWRGNTSVRNVGNTLAMSSRLAYEVWTCPRPIRLPWGGKIPIPRAHILGEVKTVNWTLFIRPAPIDEIYVSARVDDVVGWPNWLEKILDVGITEHIAIKIPDACGVCPCSQFVDSVRPKFESVDFDIEEDSTLRVSTTFSVDEGVLTEVLRCAS